VVSTSLMRPVVDQHQRAGTQLVGHPGQTAAPNGSRASRSTSAGCDRLGAAPKRHSRRRLRAGSQPIGAHQPARQPPSTPPVPARRVGDPLNLGCPPLSMPTTPRQSEPINGSEYQASPDNRLTTLGVVAARLDVECQPAATTSRAKAQGRSDRSALPIEVVHQHRGLAAGAPRSNARRGQRDTRLVEEADDGLAAPGVFLILGQSAARGGAPPTLGGRGVRRRVCGGLPSGSCSCHGISLSPSTAEPFF
jgi:hypothetical protein